MGVWHGVSKEVARPQGVERLGMAVPGETLGSLRMATPCCTPLSCSLIDPPSVFEPDPDPGLGEVGPHCNVFARRHIGITVPLKRGFKLLQLLAREMRSLTPRPLFLLLIILAVAWGKGATSDPYGMGWHGVWRGVSKREVRWPKAVSGVAAHRMWSGRA
jgi:hypothetical protein